MGKAFYFAYGKTNFGVEKSTDMKLKVNLNDVDGCGISFINPQHINCSDNKIILEVTNYKNHDLNVRVEKKFIDGIDSSKQTIIFDTTKRIVVCLTDEEKSKLKELVIAVLKEDNPNLNKISYNVSVIG